jgi:phosphoribosylaminoimidazole-succinocarboxamide synthase
MLVRKAKRVDIECVARGYIAGSAWEEYEEKGTVCGEPLYDGLIESDTLAKPIFTPATKAETGHDENISFARMQEIVGADLAARLRDLTLTLYRNVAAYAFEKNVLIADTKLEFGLIGDEIVLIDEVFTPDSSRFWSRDAYEPGKPQKSFDKQFVRDYLTKTLKWDRNPPAPALPDDIVRKTRERYEETLRMLVDRANPPRWQEPGRWKQA